MSLSWARVTVVFLVVVAILLVASHCPDSWQGTHHIAWWVGVGISAIITLLSLVTHHGLTVTSGLAGWLWDWSADPGTTLAAGCTPALDYQRRFGRDKVGVREYDGRLVTVIALDGDDDAAARHRQRSAPPASILVRSVATGLRQFDVHLDGIDIVSVQMRRGGNAAELSKLDKLGPEEWGLVSEQPASYVRRTWLVLRMNPQSNVAAVAARDSLASTLVAATERLVQDLEAPGCAPRPLTSEEIAEVDSAVLADLEPTWSRPGWRYLKHFNGFATSFWLTPSDITTETLEELWLPDAEATVVTIQLTADDGRPEVSGWVRYHSDSRLPRGVSSGLNRLTGRQLAAVRASLPAPTTRPLLVVPTRGLLEDDDLVLQVGQVREDAERLLADQ
ncbi:ESX-5 secretion system protein EccE5 [Mycobacterium montefiorense]|uniref:ESX-5 secretion system protein EccE5 n=1 Tax=Mycobacterium montefiorense TaxID=154654 RepID=A0AA37PKA2_9MYCO|nr:ESX-5 secretion system protein EccE5 [Mycobacterium montefiorense]GKU32660.1 type VII secretion protein EccE [Mycobacterium montefiorense]GKU38182.1 type VII secretion protein EccE [Mycobacterium montefiorense]GKU43469.1 type VII secretion protein EccE [Mycobacterium montefiorense]GKU50210.1 type VII secretion protein EccE [Mycobacterium montefiorense]